MIGEGYGARADLSVVATSTLERIHEAIVGQRLPMPLTRAGLLAIGVQHQLEALEGALAGHGSFACLSVLEVALAERRAHSRPAPELVWSGPERSNATARDTAVVLRALFERARRQVILAGYSFVRGSALLEPLAVAIRDRGVDVRFFVHIEQPSQRLADAKAYGATAVNRLMDDCWPSGAVRPRVYYDVRALEPYPRFNMHAKCVVVDGELALITSANFTQAAQEVNTECGVLLDDAVFAHHLARQWMGLIDAGLVVEVR